MRPAPTATRRLLADLGFFVAIIATFTLVLVGLAALRFIDEETRSDGNPFVLTRYQWVPQDEGMARKRTGFALADAEQLRERIGVAVRTGWLWRDETIAEIDGEARAVDVIALSPMAFALLLPASRAVCDPGRLWLDARDADTLGDQPSLLLKGERLPISAAELSSIRSLLGPQEHLLAVRCSDSRPTAVQALIADGEAISDAGLKLVADDPSLFRKALFQHDLVYARLNSAVGDALRAQFGWAKGVLLGSMLLALLLFSAWGVLLGLTSRVALIQRRTLGARISTLGRQLVWSTLRSMIAALLLALLVFMLLRDALPHFSGLPLPDIPGVLLLLAVSLAASLLPQWALALRTIDARLLHAAAGARRTVNLRPYLLLWSGGLGLALVFAVVASGVVRNLWSLAEADLGYQPKGLVSLPVRLPTAVDRETNSAAMLERLLVTTREHVGGAVSLICPPPWEFTSHPGVLGSDATIGLGIGGGPGILTVLGVRSIRGRDLAPGDIGNSRIVITQGSDAERVASLMRAERVASIDGIKLGALAPHARMLLISPFSPASCSDFQLLIRDPSLDTRSQMAMTAALRAQFPTLAFGEPDKVSNKIAEARSPLTRLALLLAFAAALATALQVVFTAALSMAYFDANQRDLAVRMAFGLSGARAARAFVLRSLRWALPALVVAVFVVHALQSVIVALLPGYASLRYDQVVGLCTGLFASVLLGNWLYARVRTAALPLHQALASSD